MSMLRKNVLLAILNISLLCAVIAITGGNAMHQGHPHVRANLIWNDEFNGLAGTPPDPSKWSADVGGIGWGNQELEYDTNNQNAYQDGHGNLVIEARQENSANYQCWYGPCKYTSARITTKNHFSFTHGYIEARIKIPYGQGVWPAFWLLGNNVDSAGWPDCGEIDVMENIGREPNIIHGTVHGPNYSGANSIGGGYTLSNGRFADNYHIYAAEWNSSQISFFMDDINYFTVTRAMVESHGPWVFDSPFFIVLNVAVGGWAKSPDATTVFPQKMHISYVRLYSA